MVIFFTDNKRERVYWGGGQIQVPDAGPGHRVLCGQALIG